LTNVSKYVIVFLDRKENILNKVKKMPGKKKNMFEEMEIDPDVPIYTSSVVCRLLGVPIWVLKQLDKEG